MSKRCSYSLRKRLFWRLLAVQSVVLILVMIVLISVGKISEFRSTEGTIEVLGQAVFRQPTGELSLRETEDLRQLRKDAPDLWYTIRDLQGHVLTEGLVPEEYAAIGNTLDHVGQAKFGSNLDDHDRPAARMKWIATDGGQLQFLTGTGPNSSTFILLKLSLVLAKIVIPIVAVMALGALIATPLVVRRSLVGIDQAALQADTIDIDQRGGRLSENDTPEEIAPLVHAVNRALGRLDEGYERQERFLTDAAHELRTPIAILNTRIGSLPHSSIKTDLLEDAARLAVLTEQMLDLQRLKQGKVQFIKIDLGQLARKVIIEMAPLAFAAGYTVQFDVDGAGEIEGDPLALQRALMNILQNAINHGGRKGIISLTSGCNWIEVSDEGPGIPADMEDRIFEPFFKRHHDGRGAGLGLNLVRDILRMHGGEVTINNRSPGAVCRLRFPPDKSAGVYTPSHLATA
ncbi:histidine kinase (plasmid) [Rhizobium leguminosarum bv. trifolii WSM1325]|uniref:histidine kinase n=1 Tax=Rhizobium leguminosarum bv. trifolii (strain WSM1325) TaxID=395491 RepID=C6B6D3_RHILS|nr:ATP-binding protein [Rhizobium leguminosarum]ACS59641.1 histidine kinase [Rhizobium leguminosarum bv. trifolii WSM1325]